MRDSVKNLLLITLVGRFNAAVNISAPFTIIIGFHSVKKVDSANLRIQTFCTS